MTNSELLKMCDLTVMGVLHSQQNVEVRAERAWKPDCLQLKVKVAGVSKLEKNTDIFETILRSKRSKALGGQKCVNRRNSKSVNEY
jgi:hypothetical protein